MSIKTATLVDILRGDLQRLEDKSATTGQLGDLCSHLDRLRIDMDKVEPKCAKAVNQRIIDIGLDKYADLTTRVAKVEEFVDTFKKVAIKQGLYGGVIVLVSGTVLVYVIKGLVTGDWNPFD